MLTFILRVFCKKLLYVAQKNVSTKKIFHIKLRCAPKLCESQKMCCGNKKKSFYTQKRDSCWLNMFSVAQKRNTCWTIVPIVYVKLITKVLDINICCIDYKKFCIAGKILWCRTKIKGERKKFFKNCSATFCVILGLRNFFSTIKLVFREKCNFCFILLWYYFQKSCII